MKRTPERKPGVSPKASESEKTSEFPPDVERFSELLARFLVLCWRGKSSEIPLKCPTAREK